MGKVGCSGNSAVKTGWWLELGDGRDGRDENHLDYILDYIFGVYFKTVTNRICS